METKRTQQKIRRKKIKNNMKKRKRNYGLMMRRIYEIKRKKNKDSSKI